MKSLFIIFAIMISSVSWAGGPDIPWPSPYFGDIDGENNHGAGADQSKPVDGDASSQRVFSFYIAKNSTVSSQGCPFVIVIQELNVKETGEIVEGREALHCIKDIVPVGPTTQIN